MQLSAFIETAQKTAASRARFLRLLVFVLIALLGMSAVKFLGLNISGKALIRTHFDIFHLVGQLVWLERLNEAYTFSSLLNIQSELWGELSFMPWTYPPPFNLVLAPFGLLPLAPAYLLFVGLGLLVFLLTAWRLDHEHMVTALLLALPALAMTVICGQNGLITGALIGLACIGLLDGKRWAGVPLGLMIIKPHLAITLGVYCLISRRWGVLGVAALTAALACALATVVLGPAVWTAFVGAVAESGGFLSAGLYPLYRMVSVYSTLFTLGLPAPLAMAGQIGAALLALGLTGRAAQRLPVRQALGIAGTSALLISPYGYDYDLTILAVGLLLLLPDLMAKASASERSWVYAGVFFASAYSMAVSFKVAPPFSTQTALYDSSNPPLALSSLGVLGATLLLWHIFARPQRG